MLWKYSRFETLCKACSRRGKYEICENMRRHILGPAWQVLAFHVDLRCQCRPRTERLRMCKPSLACAWAFFTIPCAMGLRQAGTGMSQKKVVKYDFFLNLSRRAGYYNPAAFFDFCGGFVFWPQTEKGCFHRSANLSILLLTICRVSA